MGAAKGVLWFGDGVFCEGAPAGCLAFPSPLGPSSFLFQIPTAIPLARFPSGFGNLILNVVFLNVPGSIHACNPHVPSRCLTSPVPREDKAPELNTQSSKIFALRKCREGQAPLLPIHTAPLRWPLPFQR